VSRLRRLVLSDRYFFLTVRLLKTRTEMVDGDFRLLAEALREARQRHCGLAIDRVRLPAEPMART